MKMLTGTPISGSDQNFVLCFIINLGYLGKLKHDFLNSISRMTQMNSSQIRSLYKWALIDRIRINQYRLRRSVKSMFVAYRRGESILSISSRYDLPPVSIFRALLSYGGRSKKDVKRIINQPEFLKPYDRDQLLLAFENDEIAVTAQQNVLQLREAQAFENEIEAILQKKGISYKTEKILAKSQIKNIGIAISTPDFLLSKEYLLQGKKIHWIECKSYFGASIPILQEKLWKQTQRYVEHWGPGLVVFKHG